MKLFDVNVLVQAFRSDAPDHATFRKVLEQEVNAPAPFALSRVVVSGFLRVVTHRKVFVPPTPIEPALAFCADLIGRPTFRWIEPGDRHWMVFRDLCTQLKADGNLIPDLWFAALAIESGCTWVSGDRDYGLVPGLDWQYVRG
ncbi:MAG: PIN domain-containing protein [Spirochaetaceae bacterium]|nr:MAG: PIN domain-containing protein [Spirochaetaceae bacterium]